MTSSPETPPPPQPEPAAGEHDSPPQFDAVELLSLIARDIRRVQDELSQVGAALFPSAPEVATAARELRDSVGAFVEKAQAASESVGKQATARSAQLREQMEKHPVAAVSSAFALGYFLGRTVFGHHGKDDQGRKA
jgi:hypothetical protein